MNSTRALSRPLATPWLRKVGSWEQIMGIGFAPSRTDTGSKKGLRDSELARGGKGSFEGAGWTA
eukprot:3259268-Rhodomonas_salina.2